MKVLVTGGSGFLGTHIRNFFNADDFSRRSNLDILNLQDVEKVEDYDVVIHLAAFLDKSPENSEECFLTNVEGTVNLLRKMRENSVFIFASTKDVYGVYADNFEEVPERCLTDYCGQSPLEWSKLIVERYVEYYGHQNNFRTCIFRLSTVYAPKSDGNEPNFVTHYLDAINVGEPIFLLEKGEPKRDFLHVEDFARACQAFIDSDVTHGLYNLGGGYQNSLTLRGLVEKIEKIVGANAVIDDSVKTPSPVPFNYVSDISKIEFELKWKPTISIEEGLRKLL
ncbi:MAG: NAD(P)-dependent oxidoreductase [Pyrinomonadaceae bacterium]|nr:NAD(P)-dependent oxidoreductase [Pyrinomonadaceae bacterium]